MPGVFPDYPAPAIRNTDTGTEMVTMRWGMPPRRAFDRFQAYKGELRASTDPSISLWLFRLKINAI